MQGGNTSQDQMFGGSSAAGRVADIPAGRLIIVAEQWKRQAVLVLSVMAEHHLKYSKSSCGVLAVAILIVSAQIDFFLFFLENIIVK